MQTNANQPHRLRFFIIFPFSIIFPSKFSILSSFLQKNYSTSFRIHLVLCKASFSAFEMFKRKLSALEYVNAESFSIADEKQFRALILWLEDQKIRHYKIEDREGLRLINSPNWEDNYKKFLVDVGCPFLNEKRGDQLEWLICYAINFEYSDNVDKYSKITSAEIQKKKTDAPKMISSNPLDNLDFESEEFKKGVNSLALMLNVTCHPDHLVTLQAVSKVVCEKLNSEALKNPDLMIPKGKPFPFTEADLGFNTGDKNLIEAGKILRLIFIQDVRRLQTQINECIVEVQKVTADPKTDTKLGKVGF